MITTNARAHARRGLTLVEMLVVVGLTVLMMTIIAQIFGATTTSFQVARAIQEIEQDLRAVEGTIQRDLAGATAKMTPPLNPKDNLGYFEYGENEFADAQGEDSDDYLAFTTRSTDGNLFLGRYLPPPRPAVSGEPPFVAGADIRGVNVSVAPTIISSDTAEVIYFLRNGNLYRRVFLVKPGLRLNHEYAFTGNGVYQGVQAANMPGVSGLGRVGWQALNDISMRPSERISLQSLQADGSRPLVGARPGELVFDTYAVVSGVLTKFESETRPIANSLGDLTNRHNRAFKPRFTNDYHAQLPDGTVRPFPDGQADDFIGAATPFNGSFRNEIDDYTAASYPNLMNKRTITAFGASLNEAALPPPGFAYYHPLVGAYDTLSFPYVFPHAYSRIAVGQPASGSQPANGLLARVGNIPPQGAIHGVALEYPSRRLQNNDPWRPYWNHNPLEEGDNLPIPGINPATSQPYDPNGNMLSGSWWGFPTWREQLSPAWIDPLKRLSLTSRFEMILPAGSPSVLMEARKQAYGLSWNPGHHDFGWLPEMVSPIRTKDQPFHENAVLNPAGTNSLIYDNMANIWYTTWEDDLIATNVRSFDVKAYEAMPEIQSYVDLGYMATPTGGTSIGRPGLSPTNPAHTTTLSNWLLGFGHEGRMPPLTTDFRMDSQYPFIPGVGPRYVGDDDAGVVRLRRVWDTWSTEYSAVNAKTLDPLTAPPFQVAPRPSYPAPYPAPLRGIQIQIRMTDPREERVRTITIHHDFTGKL